MNKCEIIERLKNIAGYAVYAVGKDPFIMSIDDGIAVHEAIELLEKPETNCSEFPNNSDTISRRKAFEYFVTLWECVGTIMDRDEWEDVCITTANEIPSAQPEPKKGHWILDRSGSYCCSKCMEPCATYVMMKPRDRYCKMCGSRNEVMG